VRTADARLVDIDVTAAPVVRLLLGPNNEIVVDSGDGTFGRGAHVHASPACLQRAVKAGLPKVVRGTPLMNGVAITVAGLAAAIGEAYDRRLEGLLSAAKRARKLQVGSDAACMSLRAGEASLVIVASDAAAAAERTEVRAAVREGAAIAWGTKARLGALLRPALEDSAPEVGVVAVTDTRIASAIRETRTVIDSVAQSPQGPQRHGEFRQDSPAIRHASILNEGTATLSPPALPGSGTEEPPLGSAE
jgi:ribosomal protein L7Ae-like RNA K-turn-binding protein